MTIWLVQDGFEDPSRFTIAVRQWAVSLLSGWIAGDLTLKNAEISAWTRRQLEETGVTPIALAERLLEDHERYLTWVPKLTFSGDDFAAGEWRVRFDVVVESLDRTISELAAERAGRRDA